MRGWGVGLGACFLFTLLGCRTLGPVTDDPTFQSGSFSIPAGEEQDVYYRVPFVSPPNLTISTTFNDCLLVEQKPDHFRVKNPNPFSRVVGWEARGVVSPQYVTVTASGNPTPTLPPTPTARPAAKSAGFAADTK